MADGSWDNPHRTEYAQYAANANAVAKVVFLGVGFARQYQQRAGAHRRHLFCMGQRTAVQSQPSYFPSRSHTARWCACSSVLKSRFSTMSGHLERSPSRRARSIKGRIRSKKYSRISGSVPSACSSCDSSERERFVLGSCTKPGPVRWRPEVRRRGRDQCDLPNARDRDSNCDVDQDPRARPEARGRRSACRRQCEQDAVKNALMNGNVSNTALASKLS